MTGTNQLLAGLAFIVRQSQSPISDVSSCWVIPQRPTRPDTFGLPFQELCFGVVDGRSHAVDWLLSTTKMSRSRRGAAKSGAGKSKDPSGLSRLGELEARVMTLIWERGGWLTPREVLDSLTPERELAYTTVMTILVRLWRKGLLERHQDGRAFAYHAVESREEWTAKRMGELLAVAEDRAETLSRFVASIGRSDRDQLRRLLRIR